MTIGLVKAQSEDGILWKISGNGLIKPSYLFGTIHYHCHPESLNKPAITNAIKASSKVAMEINLGDMGVIMALFKLSMKPSGTSLVSILSPSDYKIVDTACRYFLEDSLANMDTKSPMELNSALFMSQKFTGCKGLPVDFLIVELAKKAGKPTLGLETFQFQDSLLKTIPLELQAKWLVEFCKENEKAKRDFVALNKAYNDQKSTELYKLILESSPESNYMQDVLLTQRNIKWVNYLKINIVNEPYFIAVGAGHLGGDEGLLKLLIKSGYTLTPIQF